MLDVHPPHSPTHTWKDFFIHIATIVVGLLIAVGLEQTVEAVRHQRERNALKEDMHAEAERAIKVMDADLAMHRLYRNWLTSSREAMLNAKPSGGIITFQISPFPGGDYRIPPRSVWSIARADNTAALVPKNLAEIYTRLDYDAEQYFIAMHRRFEAEDAFTAITLRVSLKDDGSFHLTQAQANEFLAASSTLEAVIQSEDGWMAVWEGASDAVVHGVQSRDDMDAFMQRRSDTLYKK